MKLPLLILHLEDDPNDIELIRETIQTQGLPCNIVAVSTREDYIEKLENDSFDIILSDHSLPNFDGTSAMLIAQDRCPEIPFIFVTGSMGEEAAIDTLAKGATDYVLKHRLSRLLPAITRAAKESEVKRERKLAEKALKESEERFKSAFEYSAIGMALVSLNGIFIQVNQALCNIIGFSQEELLSKSIKDIIHPNDQNAYQHDENQLLNKNISSYQKEIRLVHQKEHIIWILLTVSAVYNNHDNVYYYITQIEDITDKKLAHDQLQESEDRYRRAISQADAIPYLKDLTSNKFIFIGEEIASLTGYSLKELTPDCWHTMIKEAILRRQFAGLSLEEAIQRVKEGGYTSWSADYRIETKSGETRWLSDSSIMKLNSKGKAIESLGILLDVTERKQDEAKILRLYLLQTIIRKINEALVKIDIEQELLQRVCNLLNEIEYNKFSWVGLVEKNDESLTHIAHDGKITDDVVTDNCDFIAGPTHIALGTQEPFICHDISHDPVFSPWKNNALLYGFSSCIALPLIYQSKEINQIMGVLSIYSDKSNIYQNEDIGFLKEVTSDIVVGLRSIRNEKKLELTLQNLRTALNESVAAIAKISEFRDPYTAGHEKRVAYIATSIARKLDLPERQIEGIHVMAYLHDIGKIAIPVEYLTKPTKLSPTEFEIIKGHAKIGYEILSGLQFPWPVAETVLQHHERINGSGYPQGLKGDQILLESKILAVADVVEAMSSHRPYRPALGIKTACEEISKNKGILYEPAVVDACIKLYTDGDLSLT